jgi:hypothetical protein
MELLSVPSGSEYRWHTSVGITTSYGIKIGFRLLAEVKDISLLHNIQTGYGAKRRCIVFPVRYELNLYMLCRRK